MDFLLNFPQPYNKIGDGPEGPEVRLFEDFVKKRINEEIEIIYNSFSDLIGKFKVRYISSYGKKMFISIENDDRYLLVFSFSMMGKWIIDDEVPLHTAFTFFSNNQYFHFIANPDWKFKANMEIFKNKSSKWYIKMKNIGLDVFEVTLDEWLIIWQSKRKRSKRKICVLLLDQDIISGIGNYMRCDILYLAKISPHRVINDITDDELITLFHCSKEIANTAYKAGGHSIIHFKSPEGGDGYNSLIYKKENATSCKINNRVLYWDPKIQK